MDLLKKGWAIANDPTQTKWLCPLLLLADAVLSVAIIQKIPYTEIDWTTYMQQISLYLSGERDYLRLEGATGPLVYPAAHVHLYHLLHRLTSAGADIALAQYIFAGVYLATLALVMATYRAAGAPPWVFPLLVASKRLHSIFVLRLFNDCFAVFFLFLAIYAYQRRAWTLGSVAFSVGMGVKMTLLLALPAVGVVLWQAVGRNRALQQGVFMAQVQVLLGYPFLAVNARGYVGRAFELTREFLFRWTVNWRFVGEEAFLSRKFAVGLLVGHVVLLGVFFATTWLHVSVPEAVRQLVYPPSPEVERRIARRVTPNFVLTTILTSVIVGCLCARSLHYQFYAYTAWATPFLLWRSDQPPIVVYAIWALQEIAWNVYPSTFYSSIAVVACLQVTVVAVLVGAEEEKPSSQPATKVQEAKTE